MAERKDARVLLTAKKKKKKSFFEMHTKVMLLSIS